MNPPFSLPLLVMIYWGDGDGANGREEGDSHSDGAGVFAANTTVLIASRFQKVPSLPHVMLAKTSVKKT